MNPHAAGGQEPEQEWLSSPQLPADHVLSSGAVIFPGVFDQHGCPLILFPVEGQAKIASELSKAEVEEFINYFLCLHNKKQEKQSLVSVVADLKHALLPTTRFIAETLLLLELHKRTVHTVYIIQPKKKDAAKLLMKLLAPSKSYNTSFKKVLLKEIPDLSNHIDRSQLPASLGGYLVYSHQSWAAFIKDIDSFVQEFLSVVQRLPSCISTLQALSRLPRPANHSELQHFCTTNEAKFRQLRRELGLDELLRHCECVVEKLRYPESDPCYQAMAGTALFTHTAFEMLHNHSRITAAVEKVDLLWQQAFSKARLKLQVFHLRDEALQITEKIETLLQEKLQPYKIDIAKDAAKAEVLASEFEGSIHTPAMALVRCAEDVIHTLAEVLPLDGQRKESWVLDLERLKDKLHSAVHFTLQTLRAVSNYHHYYDKANKWYIAILHENFLQELLSGVCGDGGGQQQRTSWGTIPAWRRKLSSFLKKNPSPEMEELVHLAHLSNAIPDDEVQQAGKEMSQRCMTLRKLLISSGPVAVGNLQLALQWQYDLLRSSHAHQSTTDSFPHRTLPDVHLSSLESNLIKGVCSKEAAHRLEMSPAVSGIILAEGNPPSLSSFDSGFDGVGSSQVEASRVMGTVETLSQLRVSVDSVRPALSQPQKENKSNVSDGEEQRLDFDLGSVGNSSRASFHITPKVTADSLNFEIKVKRSAALPSNPWLSLPVDDLENSYTVTITPNPTLQKQDREFSGSSNPQSTSRQSSKSQDQQLPIEFSGEDKQSQTRDWLLHSQSELEDPELSSITNVLSSTITEGRDGTMSATDGMPTLLWDSYDLHEQNLDTVDGDDISLNDWDVQEQEGLQQVEKMLIRTYEILEEEENVLAQEAVLDALVRSEDTHNVWPQWSSEDQDQVQEMSTTELAEAGVLGVEDCFDPSESDGFGKLESARIANSRADLLRELQQVHQLDKLIMKENLKILKLRFSDENLSDNLWEKQLMDTKGIFSVSKEKDMMMEKEIVEVEKLGENFNKEFLVKRHDKDTAGSSSVEGKVFADLLVESCHESFSTLSLDARQAGSSEDISDLSVSTIQDMEPSSHHPDPSSFEVEPLMWDRTCSDVPEHFEGDKCLQWCLGEKLDGSLDNPNEIETLASGFDALKDSSFQESEETSLGHDQASCPAKTPEAFMPTRLFNSMEEGREDGANAWTPQASLTPQMRPHSEVFDPGVTPKLPPPPVPTPRKAPLPVNDSVAQPVSPHSAGDAIVIDPDLQARETDTLPEKTSLGTNLSFSQNVDEQSNNNNNHSLSENYYSTLNDLSEILNDEKDASLVMMHSCDDSQLLTPQLPPDQCLEFDPRGKNDLVEDWLNNLQHSDSMRTSLAPGIQTQPPSSMREMADFKTPIALDTGSGLMKAGFADQDLPSVIFPTMIGMPKYEEIMNSNLERECYIGHDAQHMRGVLMLKHPIKNGIIRNWDEMEKIWHHTFHQLGVQPEDHPVLLTEAAMNPLENRQRMVEIMFECFAVPFTYVAMQAMLALYADGRTTGVVFDSGDGVSHSVPVFEGYCLPHAVQRFPLAGVDVTMHLKKLLQEQGVSMRTTAEEEIVRDMKEKSCFIASDYKVELSRGGPAYSEMHYTMPDGQIVTLTTERFRAPEILFKPELIGRDHYGMHESIFKSILRSDIDLRRSFLGNIVLSGGNTLLAGLPERLQSEIRGLLPSDLADTVRVSCPKDRDFSVWRGGAVMASLPSFSSAWISQDEYEEYGPQIVFRKCF